MDTNFDIGGRKFKLGKLNVFKQFHVVRRISPILSDLLPAIGEIAKVQKKDSEKSESEKFDDIAKILSPFLTSFSKLSDEDSEFLLYGLLSSVEIQIGGAWSKVATDSILMVQDMELPILLQIAGRAFMFNLSSFFAVLPAASPGAR